MARIQALKVVQALERIGIAVSVVEVKTLGDRLAEVPIDQIESPSPFCEDIESLLRSGDIDLAVHSFKDLAVEPSDDLIVAAVLGRDDPRECLVSHSGSLQSLSTGAVIGTSSRRRTLQLLSIRPDLTTRPMRGAVDDRIQQVQSGAFDGAVLAVAGIQRLAMMDSVAEVFPIETFMPSPAQAVLAIQARAGDTDLAAAIANVNHDNTRRCVEAETGLLRLMQQAPDDDGGRHLQEGEISALATTHGEAIELRARWTSSQGTVTRDVLATGIDAAECTNSAWTELKQSAIGSSS